MGAIRFSFLFASLELWFDLFSDYGPVIFWIYWVWICFKNIWDHARSIFFCGVGVGGGVPASYVGSGHANQL